MVSAAVNVLFEQITRAAIATSPGVQTDGQLLELFISGGHERAFEALVRRHGPMVLSVCRRILGNIHDAEDAFQATFVVLARRATSVLPPDLVGNWLYGVAYRVATKARTASARRRARERSAAQACRPAVTKPSERSGAGPFLDECLQGLSEKYRTPIVLCHLEGRSRQEAARLLRVSPGTLSSRLARGRKLLAKRLSRRGLTVCPASAAHVLSELGDRCGGSGAFAPIYRQGCIGPCWDRCMRLHGRFGASDRSRCGGQPESDVLQTRCGRCPSLRDYFDWCRFSRTGIWQRFQRGLGYS